MTKNEPYRKWRLGRGAYGVPATPVNFDVCTTGRVDKRKGAGLTLAKIRRTVAKLKKLAVPTTLRCGCTPYQRADGGIYLVTAAHCREHNDE